MNAADFYRALYMTIWRLNERHDLRRPRTPGNDNTGWSSPPGPMVA